MKKFHTVIAVKNLNQSIDGHSTKLECKPCVVVAEKYALRGMDLNFSILQNVAIAGQVRHIGFENSTAKVFSKIHDCNSSIWEEFTPQMQTTETEKVYCITK